MSLGASGPQSQRLVGGASFLWCLLGGVCEALGSLQAPWASEGTFWGITWGRKMGTPPLGGNRVIIEKAGDSGRLEVDVGVALVWVQAWRSQEPGVCPRRPFRQVPGPIFQSVGKYCKNNLRGGKGPSGLQLGGAQR